MYLKKYGAQGVFDFVLEIIDRRQITKDVLDIYTGTGRRVGPVSCCRVTECAPT